MNIRPLGVPCGAWHRLVGSRSFGSCGLQGLISVDQACSSASHGRLIRLWTAQFRGPVVSWAICRGLEPFLSSFCFHWGMLLPRGCVLDLQQCLNVSKCIYMNAWNQEHCIVMGWSISVAVPVSGFKAVAFVYCNVCGLSNNMRFK